jgi:hypothetical protein
LVGDRVPDRLLNAGLPDLVRPNARLQVGNLTGTHHFVDVLLPLKSRLTIGFRSLKCRFVSGYGFGLGLPLLELKPPFFVTLAPLFAKDLLVNPTLQFLFVCERR